MKTFNYRGRNVEGALINGVIQAASVEAAADQLFGSRITPIEIKPEVTTGLNLDLSSLPMFSQITEIEHITFCRQMYNLTKAGLPLDRAIRGLESSLTNQALKRVLSDLVDRLGRGNTLSDAMTHHPRVFGELYISILKVGESTGQLDLAFKDLAGYMEIERKTSKQLKSATRYPSFVLMAMGAALAMITVFVIPSFSGVFAKLGDQIPWQTEALMATSAFAVAYAQLIFGAIVLSWLGFKYWIRTQIGGLTWDRLRLKLPLVGGIFERIALGRFAKTFAILGRSGVPVVTALNVVSDVVGNKFIGARIAGMGDGVSRGESLYLTAQRSGIFLPLVLQMIAVGEESGSLPDLLDEVADFYDGEVEYDLVKLTSAIEPILIAFMAGLVAVLALGIFLPIWDLSAMSR
jgi:MSHA biogenesis protein MshG